MKIRIGFTIVSGLIAILLLDSQEICAQVEHPVKWSYGERRIDKNTIEIHLKATMQDDWHIYAQDQPANSVSKPASFKFNTGNNYILVGRVKERGKLINFFDPSSGLGAKEYSNTVDFVQVIKIRKPPVSSISGTLTYQACTDHMCLSPEDVNFFVPIK